MQSTQEIAELMLDSGRNALLALDVKISIATLGVGTGALIAGMFGMNVSLLLPTMTYLPVANQYGEPSLRILDRFLGSCRRNDANLCCRYAHHASSSTRCSVWT